MGEEEEGATLGVEQSETLQQLEASKNKKIADQTYRAGEATPIAPEDVIDEGEKIQIGDKEFATQAEAMDYARGLHATGETEKLLHDAYRQGINDAGIAATPAGGVTQSAPEEEEDDFDQKFYENPKEYLKSMAAKIRQEAMDDALNSVSQQQADAQLWTEFYSKHPDLAGFDEDCKAVLDREAEMIKTLVKTSGREKAMDYLARKTRAKFQQWAERQRPTKEVASEGGRATPTAGARVTHGKEESADGPVDFVAQMKQHRRALEKRS